MQNVRYDTGLPSNIGVKDLSFFMPVNLFIRIILLLSLSLSLSSSYTYIYTRTRTRVVYLIVILSLFKKTKPRLFRPAVATQHTLQRIARITKNTKLTSAKRKTSAPAKKVESGM
jgi:hypothetical protein